MGNYIGAGKQVTRNKSGPSPSVAGVGRIGRDADALLWVDADALWVASIGPFAIDSAKHHSAQVRKHA